MLTRPFEEHAHLDNSRPPLHSDIATLPPASSHVRPSPAAPQLLLFPDCTPARRRTPAQSPGSYAAARFLPAPGVALRRSKASESGPGACRQ
jgi:hypothetical protein